MTENGKVWDIVRPSVALVLFILLVIAVLTQQDELAALALFCILFAWMEYSMGEKDAHEKAAWEERYAHMSDDAKIDHHLDRARRYGTNHDANIAQALIERKRK